MLALNLEWFAFGELKDEENGHWFGAHLDLVGTHHLGLFYLAMRKGVDYLYEHANATETASESPGFQEAAGRPSCSARWTNA